MSYLTSQISYEIIASLLRMPVVWSSANDTGVKTNHHLLLYEYMVVSNFVNENIVIEIVIRSIF